MRRSTERPTGPQGPLLLRRSQRLFASLLVRSALFALPGAHGMCAAESPRFAEPHTVTVDVSRQGEEWIADYTFDRPTPLWLFPRSSLTRDDEKSWRAQSVRVETPGVRLTRRGAFDLLDARSGPVPRKVRIRFTPFDDELLDDYAPALRFTDGGFALFSGQFELLPLESAGEASRLPSDLNSVLFPQTSVTVTVRDGTRVARHGGEAPIYLYTGPTPPVETANVVTVFDPALPAWIRSSLAGAVTDILARHARELGPIAAGKPTIMVSWRGPTPRLASRDGGALPGQIVMAYEGAALLEETPQQRAEGMWFVAHEAAHFWLGQTAGYEYARDAWITEGGADLLAVRAIAAVDAQYDSRRELDRAIADCAELTRRRGVERARERSEHRAYYACGAVFGLVAEAASGQPFHVFVRRLVDANRADRIITRTEWLAALDAVSGDPSLSRDVARLLDRGAADPKDLIASLFTRVGLSFSLDARKLPHLR